MAFRAACCIWPVTFFTKYIELYGQLHHPPTYCRHAKCVALSPVPCPLSPVPCLLSPVSCPLTSEITMRYFILPIVSSIVICASGCGQHTPRNVGHAGARPTSSDTGLPDTGGGTMNNPTGLPAGGEVPLSSGPSLGPTPTGSKEPQGAPSLPSGVGTAGQASGPPGPGGAASPANAAGTGTGPTTP